MAVRGPAVAAVAALQSPIGQHRSAGIPMRRLERSARMSLIGLLVVIVLILLILRLL
jgi:hypothetical protein